jgi:hypothetical protein
MKPDRKFNVLRVLTLFGAGAFFFLLWLFVRVQFMDPLDKNIFIKQTCIRIGARAPGMSRLFRSCRDIPPQSIHKFACGPDFFSADHYCAHPDSKPGCHAEYYVDAVNVDQTVECSCRVYCDGT